MGIGMCCGLGQMLQPRNIFLFLFFFWSDIEWAGRSVLVSSPNAWGRSVHPHVECAAPPSRPLNPIYWHSKLSRIVQLPPETSMCQWQRWSPRAWIYLIRGLGWKNSIHLRRGMKVIFEKLPSKDTTNVALKSNLFSAWNLNTCIINHSRTNLKLICTKFICYCL